MPPRPLTPALVLLIAAAVLAAVALPSCATAGSFVRADGSVDGRLVYERRCAQCHALYPPTAFDDAQWALNVQRFGPRAGVRPEWRPAVIAWLQQANDGTPPAR